MENDKCFCHFNGYQVKDAVARNEIESIKNNVNAVSNDLATTKASMTSISSDVSKSKTDIEVLKGDASTLKTTTSLNTASISANTENISNIDNKMGELENLTTNDKSSIVNAVNSMKQTLDESDLTLLNQEINTLKTNTGSLDTLTTEDKTSVVNAINEINSKPIEDIYSTDETVIGSFLGKPLYRKVMIINKSSITTNLCSIQTDILDCDTMITNEIFWLDTKNNANLWRKFPGNYYSTNDWDTQNYFGRDGKLYFELGPEATTRIKDYCGQMYVILEYTKTTDSVATE